MNTLPEDVQHVILCLSIDSIEHTEPRAPRTRPRNLAPMGDHPRRRIEADDGRCTQGTRQHACKHIRALLCNMMLLCRAWKDVSGRLLYRTQSTWALHKQKSPEGWLASWREKADYYGVRDVRLQVHMTTCEISSRRIPGPGVLEQVAQILVNSRPTTLEAPFCSVSSTILSSACFSELTHLELYYTEPDSSKPPPARPIVTPIVLPHLRFLRLSTGNGSDRWFARNPDWLDWMVDFLNCLLPSSKNLTELQLFMPSPEDPIDLILPVAKVLSAARNTLRRLTLACSPLWGQCRFDWWLRRLQRLESYSELAVVERSMWNSLAFGILPTRELFATIPLSALPPSVEEYALYFSDVQSDWIRVSETLTDILEQIAESPAVLPNLSKISSAMLEFAESPRWCANRFGTGPVLSSVASTWARVSHSRPNLEVVPISDQRVVRYWRTENWSEGQLWRTRM
ncbi:hypothetical protein P7C70_g8994, partial [Phenoliferia sp. Uapishka_3]